MSQHTFPREAAMEAVKAVPPLTIYTLTLNEWLAVATILYIVLQAAYLVWKWRRDAKAKVV